MIKGNGTLVRWVGISLTIAAIIVATTLWLASVQAKANGVESGLAEHKMTNRIEITEIKSEHSKDIVEIKEDIDDIRKDVNAIKIDMTAQRGDINVIKTILEERLPKKKHE